MESVKLFGPLLFPLYRAALLRQRILIVTEAPVEFACNLGKSILSNSVSLFNLDSVQPLHILIYIKANAILLTGIENT